MQRDGSLKNVFRRGGAGHCLERWEICLFLGFGGCGRWVNWALFFVARMLDGGALLVTSSGGNWHRASFFGSYSDYGVNGMAEPFGDENVKCPENPELQGSSALKKRGPEENNGEPAHKFARQGFCSGEGVIVSIKALCDGCRLPASQSCRFEGVRILSMSKLRQPAGERYASAKSMVAIYVGDEKGNVVCVIIHGLVSIDDAWLYNPLVSISNMQCSPSQRGVLNIDPWHSQSIRCEKSYALFSRGEYPYRFEVCRQFASMRWLGLGS